MDLWERQPSESAKQFRAFSDYLNLGEGRSVSSLLEVYHGQSEGETRRKPPSTNRGTLETWSAKHQWVSRAEAYDLAMTNAENEAHRQARLSQQTDIIEAEFQDYHSLREQWLEQAQYIVPVEQTVKMVNGKEVTVLRTRPYDFKAHIESRKKISEGLRLAAEMPGQIGRVEQTARDGDNLFSDLIKSIQQAREALDDADTPTS